MTIFLPGCDAISRDTARMVIFVQDVEVGSQKIIVLLVSYLRKLTRIIDTKPPTANTSPAIHVIILSTVFPTTNVISLKY